LRRGPAEERVGELVLVSEAAQTVPELAFERVVDVDPVLLGRLPEEQIVDAVDAAELLDRALVVVDAEVDDDIGETGVAAVALDDQEARRLLSPAVAAGLLCRGEAVEQPLGERPAGAALERLREPVDGG